jgi:hypothetical protein
MAADGKNHPAPEKQAQSSPATDASPGLFGRTARVFGRKAN